MKPRNTRTIGVTDRSVAETASLSGVRHHAGLDLAEESRWVSGAIPEFLLPLAVDDRGPTLARRGLVSAFERGPEFAGPRDVLAVSPQRFGQLVVAQVLLKEMNRQSARLALRLRPCSPGVVVVNDDDRGQAVFRHGVDFHRRVAKAGVTGDADNRMALIRRLRADAELHGAVTPTAYADIRPDGAVLVRAVHHLSRAEPTQLAPDVTGDAIAAGGNRRLLLLQRPAIEEVAESFAITGVQRVGIAKPSRLDSRVPILDLSAGRGDLAEPASSPSCGNCPASASRAARRNDDAEADRQVRPMSSCRLIDPDAPRIGSERELTDGRHAVLPYEDHQIRASQRTSAPRWLTTGFRRRTVPSSPPDSTTGILGPLGDTASARPRHARRTRRCWRR